MNQRTLIMILAGAIVAVCLVLLIGRPAPRYDNPEAVSSATRSAVKQSFYEGCMGEGASESYCNCVGDNLSNRLTPEILKQLVALENASDQQSMDFIYPYTAGCR